MMGLKFWVYVAAAFVFTALGGSGAWWVTSNYYAKQMALLKQMHAESVAQAIEQTRTATEKVFRKYEGAINDGRKRQQTIQAAADGARDELERLRDVIAARAAQPAEPAPAACTVTATARDDLQRSCAAAVESLARELVDVARAADRHAADVKVMLDAWPTIESIEKDK